MRYVKNVSSYNLISLLRVRCYFNAVQAMITSVLDVGVPL